MERMMNRFPFARDLEAFSETEGRDPRLITQLLYNYRSLPLALDLFNKLFYGSQLIATVKSVFFYLLAIKIFCFRYLQIIVPKLIC